MSRGRLIVAGTGIKAVGHVTLETRTLIERAGTLLYMVADPATGAWIRELNPRAESLEPYFAEGRTRWDTFQLIIDRILTEVRSGADVCAVFYGHPGVFVYMSHEAIRRARAEGFDASMLPGISAEDCLIADLGVDTAAIGYQCLEALVLPHSAAAARHRQRACALADRRHRAVPRGVHRHVGGRAGAAHRGPAHALSCRTPGDGLRGRDLPGVRSVHPHRGAG